MPQQHDIGVQKRAKNDAENLRRKELRANRKDWGVKKPTPHDRHNQQEENQ